MARVLFLQNFWFEFLGTMYLSAILKQDGHQVDLFIEGGESDLMASVAAFKPDLVGMYCTTGDHIWALRTAARVKTVSGARIILGGPHPTFFPEIIEDTHIDYVCRGEGEEAVRELARALDGGLPDSAIRGLWTKSDGTVHRNELAPPLRDLDELPLPDRDIYYKRYELLRENPSKHFITGRGCPFTCSFCCNKAYNELYRNCGPIVRRHAPERVITEILAVADKYPLKSVRFDDEVFLLKPSWILAFLEMYRQRVNIPFTCLIRADLTTEENISAMSRAGCYAAYFGIESGNDRLRQEVLKKTITRDAIMRTAHYLHKYGIAIGTFNMLGIPGETLDEAMETVAINQRIRTEYPWASIVQPYPRTELLEIARERGVLEEDLRPEDFSASYFNRSVIKNPQQDQLINLHRLFYIAVKAPPLLPMIRLLIMLPPNKLFDLLFSASFGYRYIKTYRVPVLRLLKAARYLKDRF
ncbi:B12-binding domain-containing radical SAM protein [bacterium]|nr:B12-binding domain-containing radical SAM protein [candidate division CSSED10-310 bacterium]